MKHSGFRIVAALALLAAMFAAGAAGLSEIRKQAELSMLVKGIIDIGTDGSVAKYTIIDAEKLPPAIVKVIAKQVPNWEFEPVQVDGKPVIARTFTSMRIVARPKIDGDYDVGIESAVFFGGNDDEANGSDDKDNRLSVRKRTSLRPLVDAMMDSGATGDVYLALKIGPDGTVMDGIVQQVNLTAYGTEPEMTRARKSLGDRALWLVRKWTFNIPAKGELAGRPYWSGILPLSFRLSDGPVEAYGRWEAYIPGPCAAVPWRDPDGKIPGASQCEGTAAPDGAFALDGDGPKLLTPVAGN